MESDFDCSQWDQPFFQIEYNLRNERLLFHIIINFIWLAYYTYIVSISSFSHLLISFFDVYRMKNQKQHLLDRGEIINGLAKNLQSDSKLSPNRHHKSQKDVDYKMRNYYG